MAPPRLRSLTRRAAVGLAALLCGLALSAPQAQASPSRHGGPGGPARSTETDGVTNVLADYDAEIRETTPRADGVNHVDTPATIAALKAEHVNTYAYLVLHQSTDWDDLVNEFLPAAQRAEINVWVELVPPSECCSEPYEEDYVAWASAIAQLSLQYPNLKAWAMDDFPESHNLDFFTPSYMQQVSDAAHAVNPALRFFPVIYNGEYTSSFMSSYGAYFDGAIFPYQGDAGYNLNELGDLSGEIDTASAVMKGAGKRLYLMPYTSPYSEAPAPPSPATVASMIRMGEQDMAHGKLDGIVLYALAKSQFGEDTCPTPAISTQLALRAAWNTPSSGGDYIDASQQVAVDPNASSYTLTFQQADTFPELSFDTGYFDKQVLVDGTIVWQQDPAVDPSAQWLSESVDVTSALHGKTSATLTFRFVNPTAVNNFGITFDFTNVSGSGFTVTDGDLASHTGWTVTTTRPSFFDATYQGYSCDPQRELHTFQSVVAGFGPLSLVFRASAATGVTGRQRSVLVATARTEYALHESGHDQAAAVAAATLAAEARAYQLTVLAQQARAVAADLRG